MAEIRRFYEELNKFWREEICHVIEALKKHRVDSRDFERWNSFRSSLNQTIEAWKNRPPSCDTQSTPSNNTSPSTPPSYHPQAVLSESAGSHLLERLISIFAVEPHCAEYGEKVITWCLSFDASPVSSRVGAPYDLLERTTKLLSEATGVSTENVASVKGSRRCKTTYEKASALEQKTTSQLNTLLEYFSSWVAVIDGPSDDAPIDVVHPQELGELKCAWEKTRDSLRSAWKL
ncbi:hypothetical protein BGY98DRAFT_1093025 [Russula aff. rugulosa BPL654]|nr:hypothetical protein BGY98DRAFT_1093025 [Russula aff. rugulosa BPL654]